MATNNKEESLRAWITSAGGFIHPDLSLFAEDSVKGRKVIAKQNINNGTLLIKVPTSICLFASPTKGKKEASAEVESSLADFLSTQRRLTPFLRLVLQVLHEYSKGSTSTLVPFLESLPSTHNCVLGWNSVEKSALAGTTIEAEASTDIKSTFENVVAPVLRAKPEAWQGEWTSFEAFQRVCGVVQARTFHLQEDNWLTGTSTEGADLWMIPGIDMVNHSTDESMRNTSLHRKEETSQQEVRPAAPSLAPIPEPAPAPEAAPLGAPPAEGAVAPEAAPAHARGMENDAPVAAPVITTAFFTMEAEADIAAGQELLHSYGDLSDAELLNIFGFVDTMGADFTNPHNKVHLPTETLVALCQEQKSGRRLGKNFKRRKDFLKETDMLPEGFPISIQDPIPDSLVTVTQILLLSDQSEFDDLRLEIQKARKKGLSTDLLGKDTLDESEHSMFVCTNLLRTIDEQLASFQDVPSVVEGADPQRSAQAAHVRDGELAIVKRQKKELVQLMTTLNSDAEDDE